MGKRGVSVQGKCHGADLPLEVSDTVPRTTAPVLNLETRLSPVRSTVPVCHHLLFLDFVSHKLDVDVSVNVTVSLIFSGDV